MTIARRESHDSILSDDLRESKEGENALINYQTLCKQSARIIEKQKLDGKAIDNALLTYLNNVTIKKKAPKGFGFVHRKNKNEINLQSFYLRESYVDAFSESLELSKNLLVLNLARNQLTANRIIKIILKLPKTLKELNLSNNPQAGAEAFRVLAEEVLENTKYKLEKLTLAGCKINDQMIKPLAAALEYNSSLKFLDISRNFIREQGAIDLA